MWGEALSCRGERFVESAKGRGPRPVPESHCLEVVFLAATPPCIYRKSSGKAAEIDFLHVNCVPCLLISL